MKRFLTLLVFIFVGLWGKSQIRPSDSLYLWVDFREDLILINIPDQYINYRTKWPTLPKHVRVNETLMLVPELPRKDKLLMMLTNELNSATLNNKDEQLKYLGKLVLLLFYGNNDLRYFTEQYQYNLKKLTENSLVKKEAALVRKWVEMI